jgi:hypothetical protein
MLKSQANFDDELDGEEKRINIKEEEDQPEEDRSEGIQEKEAERAGIEMELL